MALACAGSGSVWARCNFIKLPAPLAAADNIFENRNSDHSLKFLSLHGTCKLKTSSGSGQTLGAAANEAKATYRGWPVSPEIFPRQVSDSNFL
jgi:hypothetical protein